MNNVAALILTLIGVFIMAATVNYFVKIYNEPDPVIEQPIEEMPQ